MLFFSNKNYSKREQLEETLVRKLWQECELLGVEALEARTLSSSKCGLRRC
jgi:hypothetical protein